MLMMRTLIWTILGAGLCGCATAPVGRPPAEMRLENVRIEALASEFTPDREVVVSYVEIPPNTTMERHWHPGEEFHYYLEGKVTIEIDGQESFIGTPGTVGHIPYKAMHTAITGPEGARAVVFRVHTAGEPVRYLEGGEAGEQ